MKRSKTIGFGGIKQSGSAAKASVPAPRNLNTERQLGGAIGTKSRVKLRYKDDRLDRLFDPYGVFESSTGKVLVIGTQIINPADRQDDWTPHFFEVGLISSISSTKDHFIVDQRFVPSDERYKNGFIYVVKR